MGIILAYQTNNMFIYVFFVCGISGLLGFLSTVFLDRAIFGVWVLPVLGNFHFNVIEGKKKYLYGYQSSLLFSLLCTQRYRSFFVLCAW